MKTLSTILAMGLLIAFTAGAAFSSDYERRIGDIESQQPVYESKIYGTVEKLPPKGLSGTWIVNGREVIVTKDSVLKEKHGKAEVGAYVEVEGTHIGNTFTAREIEVKRAQGPMPAGGYESKFYGAVGHSPSKNRWAHHSE